MIPKIHMRGAYAAHKFGEYRFSPEMLEIWAGATSRADIPEHHFPAQHGRIIGVGNSFIGTSLDYVSSKFQKISKLLNLLNYTETAQNKSRFSNRQRQKLRNIIDLCVVKMAYAGGRLEHTILDARSHLAPKGIANYEIITGKTKAPEILWVCNFAIGKEFLGGVFRNMCKLKAPNALLKRIYESSHIKPIRNFSLFSPKSWVDELKSSHVFVNLDRKGTIHDQASLLATGKSAFFEAMKEGIKDAKRLWKEEIIAKNTLVIGNNNTNKVKLYLREWKPQNSEMLIGTNWEKIGQKAFEKNVAAKFKNPKSRLYRHDGGRISDIVMLTFKPFIPYKLNKTQGRIKKIRKFLIKFYKEIKQRGN